MASSTPVTTATVASTTTGRELKLGITNGTVYALPHGAVLIKGALTADEQKALYESLRTACLSTPELDEIHSLKYKQSSWPIALWRHAYTGESNIEQPSALLAWANAMVARAKQAQVDVSDGKMTVVSAPLPSDEDLKAAGSSDGLVAKVGGGHLTAVKDTAATPSASGGMQGSSTYQRSIYGGPTFPRVGDEYKIPSTIDINSVYCQLYPRAGQMQWHTDIYLQWGMSISLGCSSEFIYHEPSASADEPAATRHSVWLESGDLLFANFGELVHCLARLIPDTAPSWWNTVENYGRYRCNIQMRDVTAYKGPKMDRPQHRAFLHTIST